MNKRFWLLLLIVSVVLSGISCKLGTEEGAGEVSGNKTEEKTLVGEMKPSKMNDDLWVELKAQEKVIMKKYTAQAEADEATVETITAVGREFEKILQKHGLTQEGFTEYSVGMSESRAMKLVPRVQRREEVLRGQNKSLPPRASKNNP